LRRYADPVVDHLDQRAAGLGRTSVGADLDRLPQSVFRRIRNEVEQDLANPLCVRMEPLRGISYNEAQGRTVSFGERHHRRMKLVEELAEADFGGLQRNLPRLHLAQVQDVPDEIQKMPRRRV